LTKSQLLSAAVAILGTLTNDPSLSGACLIMAFLSWKSTAWSDLSGVSPSISALNAGGTPSTSTCCNWPNQSTMLAICGPHSATCEEKGKGRGVGEGGEMMRNGELMATKRYAGYTSLSVTPICASWANLRTSGCSIGPSLEEKTLILSAVRRICPTKAGRGNDILAAGICNICITNSNLTLWIYSNTAPGEQDCYIYEVPLFTPLEERSLQNLSTQVAPPSEFNCVNRADYNQNIIILNLCHIL